jgi:DNA-binding beta-propeller fold protein YncE
VSAGDSATTGKLTQLAATDGCQSDTGDAGACADGRGLNGALGVAVSRDGMNVYVASDISDAVAVFFRSPFTGELVQLAGLDGCVQDTGLDGCADGKASTGLAPWP